MIKNKSGMGCLLIARQAQDPTRTRSGSAKDATRARSGSIFALVERHAAVLEVLDVLEAACRACGLHQTDIDSLKQVSKKEVAQDCEAATVTTTAAQDSETATSSTATATAAHGEAQAQAVGQRRSYKSLPEVKLQEPLPGQRRSYKSLPRMDTGIMLEAPTPKTPAAGDQH
jgi:hypothetical protein